MRSGSLTLFGALAVGAALYPQIGGSTESGKVVPALIEKTSANKDTKTNGLQKKGADDGDCYRDVYRLVSEFFGEYAPDLNGSAAASPASRRKPGKDLMALAADKNYRLEFLFVTVPDPVDSSVGWRYDTVIDSSIQPALKARGYVLDRWSYPWLCASQSLRAEASKPPRLQEQKPGVILFRHAREQELIVVFLIGEMPTSGIHKEALLYSLDVMNNCGPNWNGEIRLAGPCFSGSVPSLKIALREWSGDLSTTTQLSFRIVSGGVTNLFSKKNLESLSGPGISVSFNATVIPSSVSLRKFKDHISASDPSAKVALLIESNTGYGESARRQVDPSQSENSEQQQWLSLSYPMHISNVRSAYQKDKLLEDLRGTSAGANIATRSSNPSLPLPLDEMGDPRDLPPALAPSMSAPAAEAVLGNILSTISRQAYKYVGLLGTDLKDKLFLAWLIKKNCPDVMLFTFGSDILYTNPKYNSSLRGMTVISTYPLLSENQLWTFPFEGKKRRIQFPSESTQGLYNAIVALLGFTKTGEAIDKESHKLLEYANPFSDVRTPPLWLTVVGNGELLPLKLVPVSDATALDYLFQPVKSGTALELAIEARGYCLEDHFGFLWIIFVVLTIFCLANCLGCMGPAIGHESDAQGNRNRSLIRRTGAPLSHLRQFYALLQPRNRKSHRYIQYVLLLGCFVTQAAIYALVGGVILIPLARESPDSSRHWDWITVYIFSGCLVALLLATATATVRTLKPASRLFTPKAGSKDSSGHGVSEQPVKSFMIRLQKWRTALFGSIWLIATALLYRILHEFGSSYPQYELDLLFYYERARSLSSGVSPILPLLLVSAAFYLACWIGLKRLLLIETARVRIPLAGSPGGRASAGISILEKRVNSSIKCPFRGVPKTVLFLLLVILFGLPCWMVFRKLVRTLEPSIFDLVFWTMVGLVYLGIVVAFLHFLHIWRNLKRLLDRLASHSMAIAFDRLPPSLSKSVGSQFWARLPVIEDFQTPVRELLRLQQSPEHLHDLAGVTLAYRNQQRGNGSRNGNNGGPPFDPVSGLERNARAVESTLRIELAEAASNGTGRGVRRGRTEKNLMAAAFRLAATLEGFWDGLDIKQPNGKGAARKRDLARVAELGEDILATQVVTFIKVAFVHLRSLLTFVTAGPFLLLLAFRSYPFQPQSLLTMITWTAILSVVVVSVTVFIQASRNEVLSRIAKTPPNKVTFDGHFVSGILSYGLLPVLGLAATQLPHVQSIVQWIEPLLKSYK